MTAEEAILMSTRAASSYAANMTMLQMVAAASAAILPFALMRLQRTMDQPAGVCLILPFWLVWLQPTMDRPAGVR